MATTLTKLEGKMLNAVLRPRWPKFAILRIVLLTIWGLGLWILSIRDLLRLDNETMTRIELTHTFAWGCAYAGFGGMCLISAIWACMIRCYVCGVGHNY